MFRGGKWKEKSLHSTSLLIKYLRKTREHNILYTLRVCAFYTWIKGKNNIEQVLVSPRNVVFVLLVQGVQHFFPCQACWYHTVLKDRKNVIKLVLPETTAVGDIAIASELLEQCNPKNSGSRQNPLSLILVVAGKALEPNLLC